MVFFYSQVLNNLSDTAESFVVRLEDYNVLISKARQNLINRADDVIIAPEQQENTEENEERQDLQYTISVDHMTGATKFQQKEMQLEKNSVISADELVSLHPSPKLRRSASLSVNTSILKSEESNFKRTATISNPGSVGKLHPALPKFGGKSKSKKSPSKSEVAEIRKKNPTFVKNAVYCVVILEEFMKELAAISIEHTLQ